MVSREGGEEGDGDGEDSSALGPDAPHFERVLSRSDWPFASNRSAFHSLSLSLSLSLCSPDFPLDVCRTRAIIGPSPVSRLPVLSGPSVCLSLAAEIPDVMLSRVGEK